MPLKWMIQRMFAGLSPLELGLWAGMVLMRCTAVKMKPQAAVRSIRTGSQNMVRNVAFSVGALCRQGRFPQKVSIEGLSRIEAEAWAEAKAWTGAGAEVWIWAVA